MRMRTNRRDNLAKDKTTSADGINAATQQVEAKLQSDVAIVGTDPIEDLRPVTELAATSLAAACTAVETYLEVDRRAVPGCRRLGTDRAQQENRFEATAQGSPRRTRRKGVDGRISQPPFDARRMQRSRSRVRGMRTVLQTAQEYVDAENRFETTAVDSAEETTANNDMTTDLTQLPGQIEKCPK